MVAFVLKFMHQFVVLMGILMKIIVRLNVKASQNILKENVVNT